MTTAAAISVYRTAGRIRRRRRLSRSFFFLTAGVGGASSGFSNEPSMFNR
jgi:hypothetical protein